MFTLKEDFREEDNDNSISDSIREVMSKPAFSPGPSDLALPVQCPREDMTPNGQEADLLLHDGFIDPVCGDRPAKAAYVNGSASPHLSDEVLLDISKNVPGFLPKSAHTQHPPNLQFEDCDSFGKDGEVTIRQMVTAEDVEHRGIWGFDTDSPENSLDGYGGGTDLTWNPHKEFMKFLIDEHSRPEAKEKLPTPCPSTDSRRRKRKMDMVVMADPSEKDFTEVDLHSSREPAGGSGQVRKISTYSNGTTVALSHLHPKPAENRKGGPRHARGEEATPVSDGRTSKGKSGSHRHSNQTPKSFVCKECGRTFFDHSTLLKHNTVHQKKKQKIVEGASEGVEVLNEGKEARLGCPQCSFRTNSPNDFVIHAKTHEKDKRYHACQKCEFRALNEVELMSHVISKHPVISKHAQRATKTKRYRLQKEKGGASHRHTGVQRSGESSSLVQSNKSKTKLNKSISTLLSRKAHRTQRHSDSHLFKIPKRPKSPELVKSHPDDVITVPKARASLPPSKRNQGRLPSQMGNSSGEEPYDEEEEEDDDDDDDDDDNDDEGLERENSTGHSESVAPVKTTPKKLPSKRKMSTPFHNLQGQDILIDFPKCRQMFQKNSDLYPVAKHKAKGSGGSFQVVNKNSSPAKGSSEDVGSDPRASEQTPSIKEECVETEVCADTADLNSLLTNGNFRLDLKSCPYCPALFESGIGLSNHIRGHLHRVGVSYKARHAISAAQVASQDKGHIVRRRVPAVPRIKPETEISVEPQRNLPSGQKVELVCPLCREWFISKTGLSNHVRGHLKHLGRPCTSSLTKSPVIILKQLMRDKKQFQLKLDALEKKFRMRKSSLPFRLSNGLMFSASKVQRFVQRSKQHRHAPSNSAVPTKWTEVHEDELKSSPSSDLIGILKKRRAHEEARAKTQTARKALLLSPVKERGAAVQQPPHPPVSEKNDLNRRVCVHCNTSFPSGVSLSNHLRAYARRKRNALLEGTTFDCKKKQRSRSWSKKKHHLLLQSPEEVYRLTCRFCDLVFQGPLSVQEDWVKHLQRHIMNTAVPHTGAAMVEVTAVPTEPTDTHTPQTSV